MSVAHPLQPRPSGTRRNSELRMPGPPDPVAGTSTEWQEVSVAKEDRGFASMDRVKQREIASKGGKAAHAKGTAHEWTSEEAREAGRNGGMPRHRRKSSGDEAEANPPAETGGADEEQGSEVSSIDSGGE